MSDQSDTQATDRSGKAREAFRTISEVADQLDLPQHVLRFWESKFSQVRPLKRGGNRRYYRPEDVRLLVAIKHLLHGEGYTIRGVQKLFKEQGLKATIAQALDEPLDADALKRVQGVKAAPSLMEANYSPGGEAVGKKQILESPTVQSAHTYGSRHEDTLAPAPSVTEHGIAQDVAGQYSQESPSQDSASQEKKKELSDLLKELRSIRSELT
ncbi:hypothetical protein GCM10017044_25350 [Kordiimonas sediminis]|uniref:HTH merR-type domain-containing protein n=1 Tax=Kordiimonas sediminis TaxID=1735581 RepID=A0A919AY30_9PROT|nr:MerR family transcriptional regulator [Kordiimonas sediminis]GHF29030.1 hypothetical protein GCM10017044_25350 [Kordiimonas sediminis]